MICPNCKDQGHEIEMERVEIVTSQMTHENETEHIEEVLECPDCGYREEE